MLVGPRLRVPPTKSLALIMAENGGKEKETRSENVNNIWKDGWSCHAPMLDVTETVRVNLETTQSFIILSET